MAIEPIKGFYVHDEATDTDGVSKVDYEAIENVPFVEPLDVITDTLFDYSALTPYQMADGWELVGDGYCRRESGSKLVKYRMTGEYVKLKLSKDTDGVYQFQPSPGVPTSGDLNVVAVSTTPIDGVVKVPTNGTYLIVSQSSSNTANVVEAATKKTDERMDSFMQNSKIVLESGNFREADNFDIKQDNPTRLRTACMLPIVNVVSISAPEGYILWVYQYDADKQYIPDTIGRWMNKLDAPLYLDNNTKYVNLVFRDEASSSTDLTNLISEVQNGIEIVTANVPDFRELIAMCSSVGTANLNITKEGIATFYGAMYLYGEGIEGFYFIHTDTPISFDFSQNGKTLIIDTKELTVNEQPLNNAANVFKVVDYGQFDRYCIPIANRRYSGKGVFVSGPFLQFLEEDTPINIEDLKLQEFKEAYYPYTNHNYGSGWVDRVNIMHITDTHIVSNTWQGHLEESIDVGNKLFSDGIIKAVVNTGDHTNGAEMPKADFLTDYNTNTRLLATSTVPYLMLLGNHDANHNYRQTLENIPTNEELYPPFEQVFAQSGVVAGDATNKKRYHYYDVTQGGHSIRIIMLDMLDHPDYDGSNTNYDGGTCVYSQAQIDWLANVALNVPDGYGVIIGNHYPFGPSRSAGYSEVHPALNDGGFAQGWTMVPEIIEAWQNRTLLSKTYHDTVGSQNIVANYDFSNVPSGAEFICYLVGHTHSKNEFRVEEEGGVQFNQFMLCEDSSGQQGTALNRVYKRWNTIYSNAFSCLSIDMDEKKIYRTSYGCYKKCSDPTVQQTQVFSYDFSNE